MVFEYYLVQLHLAGWGGGVGWGVMRWDGWQAYHFAGFEVAPCPAQWHKCWRKFHAGLLFSNAASNWLIGTRSVTYCSMLAYK
jgi:hypothetical protein